MKRGAIVLLMVVVVSVSIADEPRFLRSFISANGQYEFKVTTPSHRDAATGAWTTETWSFTDKQRGQDLYTLDGLFGSRTVLVSSDGRHLVVVDDYSDRLVAEDLDVLAFYRDGALLRRYTLGDLVRDTGHVSHSSSHFDWCFGPLKAGMSASRFSVTTYDLVTHVFDLDTGALVSVNPSQLLSEGAVYVYGPITRVGRRRYAVDVQCTLFGDVPCGSKLVFTQESEPPLVSTAWPVVRQRLSSSDRHRGVIIRDGHYVGHTEVILNACGC